jgi:hypothetical protein
LVLLLQIAPPRVFADEPRLRAGHGAKGFELESDDGDFLIQIQSRLQFRLAYPGDADPLTLEDFEDPDQLLLRVNRARLKIGGHGHRPWLKYFFEYELAQSNLLDFRFMLERYEGARVKIGQWKIHYNRERVISSGKQQMMDRSLINRPFTLDRQQGIAFYGRLRARSATDFSYWLSMLTGTGRGSRVNDDGQLMWMGRLQWNPLGRVVPFSGSDPGRTEDPALLVGLAAVTNRSPYTRFSQDGGGQLEGFEEEVAGQYRVSQWMLETAYVGRGFAWQQELHWKQIDDRVNDAVTTLMGNYAQAGYFFHGVWESFPEPLELALRHSIYDPNLDRRGDFQQELALAGNWFFAGHRNKLTGELTWFLFDDDEFKDRRGLRFRLQWDISI